MIWLTDRVKYCIMAIRKKEGDQMKREGFRRIYEEYHLAVAHAAFDVVKDHDLAAEVCLRVFVVFHEEMEVLDEGRVKGWLLKNAQEMAAGFQAGLFKKNDATVDRGAAGQELTVGCKVES